MKTYVLPERKYSIATSGVLWNVTQIPLQALGTLSTGCRDALAADLSALRLCLSQRTCLIQVLCPTDKGTISNGWLMSARVALRHSLILGHSKDSSWGLCASQFNRLLPHFHRRWSQEYPLLSFLHTLCVSASALVRTWPKLTDRHVYLYTLDEEIVKLQRNLAL